MTKPVVINQHINFNIAPDADLNVLAAAFNTVLKPTQQPESRWQTFVDAAVALGLRAYVDGATGEVKVVSPSTYYLDKPKGTPDAPADQQPTPPIEKQWHDFGHWLVTAFQPGKVDEAAVLHPGGKYESGPEFCRRALQLALDRGAFNINDSGSKDNAGIAERLLARTIGPVPGPGESLAGRRFKLIEVIGEG